MLNSLNSALKDKKTSTLEKKENDPNDKNKNNENVKKDKKFYELDIVFCMDCTSSMGSYIKQGQNSIISIMEKIKASEKADVRFAYVAYRDHPPQDSTFITKVHDFTSNTSKMREYVLSYSAFGGGDGPEAVTQALHDSVYSVTYRKNSIKIVIIIADAPPHGLGCSGDGFPEGDPNGKDPIKIAKEMLQRGIVLYVVACEPQLSNFKYAHDLMAGLAKITEGTYLPLTGAHLLPDVIVGGAKKEISLKKLENFVADEMNNLKKSNPKMSEIDISEKISHKMNAMGMKQYISTVDDVYGNYNNHNINIASNSISLAEARKNMVHLKQPQMKSYSMHSSHAPSYHSHSHHAPVSTYHAPYFNNSMMNNVNNNNNNNNNNNYKRNNINNMNMSNMYSLNNVNNYNNNANNNMSYMPNTFSSAPPPQMQQQQQQYFGAMDSTTVHSMMNRINNNNNNNNNNNFK